MIKHTTESVIFMIVEMLKSLCYECKTGFVNPADVHFRQRLFPDQQRHHFSPIPGKCVDIGRFQSELFHYKLSIQANYDRGILGGTPEAIKEKFRIKTNLEMIPTLREAYLQMNDPGIDLLGYKRNLTMLTNEEVSDVAVGTAATLVPLWIGNLVALPIGVGYPPCVFFNERCESRDDIRD